MENGWGAMENGWGGPQLAVATPGTLVELAALLPAAGRFFVARLDATRMPDADHAFYEFSDALIFPGYFGWNWNALTDCLGDLHWLPADGYLIIIENAPRLLPGSAEDRHTLFRVLSRAVRSWSNPLTAPGGTALPFTVLLLCDQDEETEPLRQEIARAVRARR